MADYSISAEKASRGKGVGKHGGESRSKTLIPRQSEKNKIKISGDADILKPAASRGGGGVCSENLNKKFFKVTLATKMWAATFTPCTPYQDEPLPVVVMALLLLMAILRPRLDSEAELCGLCRKTSTSPNVDSMAGLSTNANLRSLKFPRRWRKVGIENQSSE